MMFLLSVERYPNHNPSKEEQAQWPLSANGAASVLAKQDT